MFFKLPSPCGGGGDIAVRGFDSLRHGGEGPKGEKLVIEGGEKLTNRLVGMMLPEQLKLLLEPLLLLERTF